MLSVTWEPNRDTTYTIEGRAFTLYELKKALVLCCGGNLTPMYTQIDRMCIWEIIEAIELVAELKEAQQDSGDVDIFEAYK